MIRFYFLLIAVLAISCNTIHEKHPEYLSEGAEEKYPHDFMFMQRAYPTGQIKTEAYKEAVQWKRQRNTALGGAWELVGPVNIGGRITDIEIPIDQPQTYYVGAASGGVFKTTDAGANWTPIFDNQEMLSIGDIAISKNNTDLIWVGTGEVNAGGGSLAYDGDGIYKSTNGGSTWEVKGLPDVGSIGKIVIDPNDDNTLFVGAMGPLFRNDNNRGVYRSTDGGDTWEQKLFVSDSTGVIDMAIHPSNGNIVYAAAWQRVRRPQYRQYGGETSGIYRSVDGGDTWAELTNGLPSSPNEKGRISIDISQSNPDVLYARYADTEGSIQGVYRTSDGGDTWVAMNSTPLTNVGFHWWFRGIVVDPTDENTIYNIDFEVQKSTDGGNTWTNAFINAHVDQHALAFNAGVSGEVLLGNDGGLYKSPNAGASWTKDETLPITQFYRIFINHNNDNEIYGGAQDNSTVRTLTGSTTNWQTIYGGDGFQPLVDYTDPNTLYAQSQYGNIGKSTNGGASFVNATTGISGADRKNWDTPITFDPLDSQILYTGTQRVYKTTNAAGNWTPISPDLTNGPGGGNLNFGTIISIDVSAFNSDKIIAGTDDGNVWFTLDGGANWTNISQELPNRWVTKVLASRTHAGTIYVTLSGYRYGEDDGHVYVTHDNGSTWENISTTLPDIPVNDIVQDENGKLYIGTDIGVFGSGNGGASWDVLGAGMPTVVITDLFVHDASQYLYAGTYGRSMYKLDLSQVILGDHSLVSENTFTMFPNPASGIVNIQTRNTLEGGQVMLYDITGKQVLSETYSGTEKALEVSQLPAGMYMLTLQAGKTRMSKQLIVQ